MTVLKHYRDQQDVYEALTNLGFGEEPEMDKVVESPEDGILAHGLFMDGFRWDDEEMVVTDSIPGEMMSSLPMIHMEPCMDLEPNPDDYVSPLYKTGLRAGTLSTTGEQIYTL